MYQLDEKEINIEFKKEPFESTVWDVVQMCCPMDIRNNLRTPLENRDWEQIENIFECMTHQMTFYSATYLVLPYMVELLGQVMEEGDADHAFTLIFHLGICLATDVPENHFEKIDSPILEDYNAAAQKLAGLTKRYINTYIEEIHKMDQEMRRILLVSAIAILGDREAAYELVLSGLDLTEIGVMCGGECQYYEDCFEPFEDDGDQTVIPAEYRSGQWDGKFDQDMFVWTSALADMLDAKEDLESLRYLYGTFTCPVCGKTKRVIEFMKTYFAEA